MARGTITPVTPQRFRQLLQQIGGRKLPVVLDSPGGDLDAALEIGRMVRAAGLTTIVGRTEIEGCIEDEASCFDIRPSGVALAGFAAPGGDCSAACLLVLAGGRQRIGYWVSPVSFPALSSFESRKLGSEAAEAIASYFSSMGISPGLIPRLRRSSLPLDRSELLHFGLSTGRQRVEDFTGSSICLGMRPAPNCLTLAESKPPAQAAKARFRSTPPRPGKIVIWGALGEM